MTPGALEAVWMMRASEIDRAIVGESARWGDAQLGSSTLPYTRDDHWLVEQGRLLDEYISVSSGLNRSEIVLNQFRGMGLYPGVEAPVFSQHGGYVSKGFELSMSAPTGQIYFTRDGCDPRLEGGGVNTASALLYNSGIYLNESSIIKARVRSGGVWSALNEAVFAVGGVAESLRVTEIMYHPADPNEEFIELRNVGAESVNLNLVSFTDGIRFTFGSLEVGPGEYVVVVSNQQRFGERYPAFGGVIAGEYEGNLANGGERIELVDAAGTVIQSFTYKDGWYDITDGDGFSLTIVDAYGVNLDDWGVKSGWRPSGRVGGSPGYDDGGLVPEPGSVVINEVLAHSHGTGPDWVELHNTTGETVNIGGWYLSDSDRDDPNLMKYRIGEGTVIEPNGFVVFYEDDHFGNLLDEGCDEVFALSENGDTVYLRSGEGGVLTGYTEDEDFGASASDVAFGRYYKSALDGGVNFVAMSENTPGEANGYPKVGPVVISEVMYHPAVNNDAEYVEIVNVSGRNVALWDPLTGGRWRLSDGAGFEFIVPVEYVMKAGERVLFVKSKAAFYAEGYTVEAGVEIFEWGAGSLGNGGDRVQLSMPGDVDGGGVRQYIRVDRVVYEDGVPWPIEADGGGASLERKVLEDYGNDVINWQGGEASPGL